MSGCVYGRAGSVRWRVLTDVDEREGELSVYGVILDGQVVSTCR